MKTPQPATAMTMHGEYYLPKMKSPNPFPVSATEPEEGGYENTRRKVEAIEKNLARLSEFIYEAISKCRPFLVGDPRDANEAVPPQPVLTPPMSPHAHALDNLNDRVWNLGSLVKEFTSSIDS